MLKLLAFSLNYGIINILLLRKVVFFVAEKMIIDEFYKKLDSIYAQHDMKAAELYLTDSLAQAKAADDVPAITAVSNELAGLYRAAGKVDEAINLSKDVLQKLKDLGQETTENFAVALQNGANIMLVANELDAALDMYKTAESILVYRGFEKDYRMAALCNNISALYRQMERFSESEEAAVKSVDIITEMPECKIELATSLVNLGEVRSRLGKYDTAEKNLRSAISIFEKESGGKDIHYSAAFAALGALYYYKGDFNESVQNYKRALELIERDFGRTPFYELTERNLKKVEEEMKK